MTTDEETRAMSRLLTRGATMLDDACDDCGNPLFRHKGEVLCPVCQKRLRDEEGDGEDTEGVGESEEATASGRETHGSTDDGVNQHLRVLAERLARDAAEHADDPEAVERRLDALERTLDLIR